MAMRPNNPVGVMGQTPDASAWARRQLIAEGNPESWLNTAQGQNLIAARARNYQPQAAAPTSGVNAAGYGTSTDPYANNRYVDPVTDPEYWGGKGKEPWAPGGHLSLDKAPANPMQAAAAPVVSNIPKMDQFRDEAMKFIAQMQNPYAADSRGRDNVGLQNLKSQISGQTGNALASALKDQQEGNALRGIRTDSNLAQNQSLQARLMAGQQKSQALTGLDAANYDKQAEFGKWQATMRGQMEQAANNYDVNRFNALRSAYEKDYENARQQPFDALKLEEGGINNRYLRDTIDGKTAFDKSTYSVGVQNNTATSDLMSRLMADPDFMKYLVDTYKNRALLGSKQSVYDNVKQDAQPIADIGSTLVNGAVAGSTIYNNVKGQDDKGFMGWLGDLWSRITGGGSGQGQSAPTTKSPAAGLGVNPLPGTSTSGVFGTPSVTGSTLPKVPGFSPMGDYSGGGLGGFGIKANTRNPFRFN